MGIAGESRSGDANGEYIRVGLGTGTNVVDLGSRARGRLENVGSTLFPLLGAEPPKNSSAKTPIRPSIPCENQETPDLRSGGAAAPPPTFRTNGSSGPASDTTLGRSSGEYAEIYSDFLEAQSVQASGNALQGRNLMQDVTARLRAFDREYGDFWDKVGGEG